MNVKKIVGWLLMIGAWPILNIVYQPPLFSRETLVTWVAFVMVACGSSILDTAKINKWPWDAYR